MTYLAAGERLNPGHALYALTKGDRPMALNPPYWSVPLLSPPPVAVLWRPFAALPGEAGVWLWWGLSVLALASAVGVRLHRRPVLAGTAVLLLSIPLAGQLQAANLDCLFGATRLRFGR